MDQEISPELKRELDQIQVLEKDNNRMLRAIRRGQWFSTLWTVLVWAIAISLPLYLYQQYLQPIVAKFYASPTSAATAPSSGSFSLPTSAELQKLINSFTAGK
ncbi:MAG: hypothetical protein ACHQU0_01625 [Candidatus Paceibacteria bacterium]